MSGPRVVLLLATVLYVLQLVIYICKEVGPPVGSLFNYASMTYESSNIDKYGLERAMARVSGDLFYDF